MTIEQTLSYTVTGMSCGHCERAVTDHVTRVTGVRRVEVDLPSSTLTVQGEAVDDANVRAAIEEAGYAVAA